MKAEFDEFVGLGLANKKEFDLYKRSDFDVCDDTAKNAVVTPPLFSPYILTQGALVYR